MQHEKEPLEISITRSFSAPRDRVFSQWLDADAIKDWFVPQTCEGVSAEVDARVGGSWQVAYRTPSGDSYREYGVFREIAPFQRLVLTLTQSAGTPWPETTVVVTFEEADDGGTLMRFHQSGFESTARRDGVAEGWLGCFDKLAAQIER
jgi:uncharacterized protein YndB with AHSA1/START domain